MTGRTIDVAEIIEQRKFDGFNIRLIAISWLITVFDGFDLSIAAFTAPYMRDELRLSTSEIAQILSAGLLGMTIGGVLLSTLSDRTGRRPVVIGSAIAFGVLTVAIAFAPSFQWLVVLRLLDGIAIGGLVPIAWALNVEFVSKRLRATVVTVIMVGYSVGTSGAGPMTVWLEPIIGWRGLFIFGGVGSLVAAGLLFLWLPESLRLMVSRGKKPASVARLLNKLAPNLSATGNDRFFLGDEEELAKTSVCELFRGWLRWATPLLWCCFTASSVAIYFANGWGPIILEALHFDRKTAALATAFGGIMGSAAGLAIMRFTDRLGPITVLFYPILLLPILLVLGSVKLPPDMVLALAMLVLALIGGMHFAIMSIIGTLYPTPVRGQGSGWASSVGKLGGVLGPILGGVVLSSGIPVIKSYLLLAICPALVLLTIVAILLLRKQNIGRATGMKA